MQWAAVLVSAMGGSASLVHTHSQRRSMWSALQPWREQRVGSGGALTTTWRGVAVLWQDLNVTQHISVRLKDPTLPVVMISGKARKTT